MARTRYHIEVTLDMPDDWTVEQVRHHVKQITVTANEKSSIVITPVTTEAEFDPKKHWTQPPCDRPHADLRQIRCPKCNAFTKIVGDSVTLANTVCTGCEKQIDECKCPPVLY